jgi:hypothetical protein
VKEAIQFVAKTLWRWDIVAICSPLLYGFGVGAMYGDDYVIAAGLYLVSIVWLTAKAIVWEEIKGHSKRRGISILILILACLLFMASLEWVKHRFTNVRPSPTPPMSIFENVIPSPEQAKLEIFGLNYVPVGTNQTPYPFFNVMYANIGRLPSRGFLTNGILASTDHELTEDEREVQMTKAVTMSPSDLQSLYEGTVELEPGDPGIHFYSIPSHAGEVADILSAESESVAKGKRFFYIFTVMFYRDSSMPLTCML